jgi:hypothetical protein
MKITPQIDMHTGMQTDTHTVVELFAGPCSVA